MDRNAAILDTRPTNYFTQPRTRDTTTTYTAVAHPPKQGKGGLSHLRPAGMGY